MWWNMLTSSSACRTACSLKPSSSPPPRRSWSPRPWRRLSSSTATGELKPNDAAVRTAETRAFKRAMEALAGDTVFAWLRFAENFALTQLQAANTAATQAAKGEQVRTFSKTLQKLFHEYVKQRAAKQE